MEKYLRELEWTPFFRELQRKGIEMANAVSQERIEEIIEFAGDRHVMIDRVRKEDLIKFEIAQHIGLDPDILLIIWGDARTIGLLHKDGANRNIALNIPLINAEEGVQEWYEGELDEDLIMCEYTRIRLAHNVEDRFDDGRFVFNPAAQLCLTKPTLVNTNDWHRLNNSANDKPRFVMSIRFKDNPTLDEAEKKIRDTMRVLSKPAPLLSSVTHAAPEQLMRFYPTSHNYLAFSTEGEWRTEYSLPPKRMAEDARAENQLAAAELCRLYGTKPLALYYDGTMEAEMMLRAFKDSMTIPRVVAVRYTDNSNKGDIEHLLSMHAGLSFTLRVIDVDPVQFWTKRATEVPCGISAKNTLARYVADATSGIPVIPFGAPVLVKTGDWLMGDHEQLFALDAYVEREDKTVVPAFFRFTPEQLISMVEVSRAVGDEEKATHSWDVRSLIYQTIYPELTVRPDPVLHPLAAEWEKRSLLASQKKNIRLYWRQAREVTG